MLYFHIDQGQQKIRGWEGKDVAPPGMLVGDTTTLGRKPWSAAPAGVK